MQKDSMTFTIAML